MGMADKSLETSKRPDGLPDWWPDNPYYDGVFVGTAESTMKLVEANENPKTAMEHIAGYHGRLFWNIASRAILAAYRNHLDETAGAKFRLGQRVKVKGWFGSKANPDDRVGLVTRVIVVHDAEGVRASYMTTAHDPHDDPEIPEEYLWAMGDSDDA